MDSSHAAMGLNAIATWEYSLGGFGLFIYGVLYRVLVAFGLHHLLNNVFWFQLGTYETPGGASCRVICRDFLQAIRLPDFLWLDCSPL